MSDTFTSLVSTQWLAERLASPRVVVLDASKHLPTTGRDARAEFEAGHIPNARFLDLDTLTDKGSSVPAALPTPQQVAQRLADVGAERDYWIVLYDDSAIKSSARAWFALKAHGVAHVSILDGGLAKWRGEGRGLSQGMPEYQAASLAELSATQSVATKEDVLDIVKRRAPEPIAQILDARSADRVFGAGTDPVHGGLNGRIPGALNVPFGEVFEKDGVYKPADDLRALFGEADIDWTRPIITTCGSGVTASVLAFALHLAGHEAVSLYDGSWQEWEADPDTPKAQGFDTGPEIAPSTGGTLLARAGRRAEWTGPVVNTPVWRASTHLYASEAERKAATGSDKDGDFFYGRRGAPTQWSLAEALTELEPGAEGTVLYPSGVAAIAGALLTVLKPGDTLLMSDNSYDPSRSMASGLMKRMGIEAVFFDPLDHPSFGALLERHEPGAVWFESPGSLTMEVCDVPALTAMAREAQAVSLIDNTWASPLAFAALEHGCDIAMMSLSKHVGGHSDLMMGSCSASERWYKALRHTAQALGQVVSPDDAALAARGLRTMHVRLERASASALAIAEWLAEHPKVAQVLCPMRPGDASYDLWSRDFTGGCGLFSFTLASEDAASAGEVVDALQHFGIGYSWGGFESLALPIYPHTHRDVMNSPSKSEAGIRPAIRLSIGLEDPADLIADLAQSLAQLDE
ncbi:MAG: cystathionine beta-lyase [Pseudomonadota bacterium]